MSNLRIGIPSKGRLSELTTDLLKQAGMSFRRQDRSLFARVRGIDADITFLKSDDIPVLCAEGAIDLGITGSDLVSESGVAIETRLALGVGRCRLAVCVPEDASINSPEALHGKRVATSFPNVTRSYLQQHGASAHLVEISGSVEIMVTLGVADAVVDLVETGSTLAANRLKILDTISWYETVLIQNQEQRHSELANLIVRRLEGAIIANSYSLVEYNIPRDKLAEAEKITPGFDSPTINSLEDPDWCSVRVMIKRGEVIEAMDQLEKIGAHAVFETRINNCRL